MTVTLPTSGSTATSAPRSLWADETPDLDAYFARIGYSGPREATLATLTELHRRHVETICFESIDVGLDIPIPTGISGIQEKLVHRGRGGMCLEHNLLFAAVLEALGFTVHRHLARVRRGNTTDVRFRSHTMLTAEAEGRTYLVDVGFGDAGPLHPVPFEHEGQSTVGDWTWQVVRECEETWVFRTLNGDSWFDVYAFGLETQAPSDFVASFHYTATHPKSVFTGHIVAQRGDDKFRHVLRDRVLRTQHPDGSIDEAHLTADQAVEELREGFRVTLSDEEAAAVRAFLGWLPE
ncbi:arylamine N-acetyltransferase family protein [Streptomyces sp. NPDC001700]